MTHRYKTRVGSVSQLSQTENEQDDVVHQIIDKGNPVFVSSHSTEETLGSDKKNHVWKLEIDNYVLLIVPSSNKTHPKIEISSIEYARVSYKEADSLVFQKLQRNPRVAFAKLLRISERFGFLLSILHLQPSRDNNRGRR
ncbi:hypothetical protein YC2023_115029 [Brassica napus]